jgi:hypothetical protein
VLNSNQIYAISGTYAFSISLNYSDTGFAKVDTWGNNTHATLSGIAGTQQQTDTINVDLTNVSAQVVSGGTTSQRSIGFTKEISDTTYSSTISNFQLTNNNSALLRVSPDGQVITFTSSITQAGYVIRAAQAGITQTTFLASTPPVQANDTDIIYLDWSRPSTATLQVDHGSDGSVDGNATLTNLAHQIYFPLAQH